MPSDCLKNNSLIRGSRLSMLPAIARVLALSLTVLLFSGSQTVFSASPAPPSVTDPRYFVGANVPWFNWGCDFGCGNKNGVSTPAVNTAIGAGFGKLQVAGVHSVRWWAFEGDASSQITRDASGAPTGLNPMVYADFDAAIVLADKYDLAYDFVLFSAPTALPRAWITDPTQRQRLADVLAPLFERYKNHPRILAWEIVNEPEWDIWNNKIPQPAVRDTVKLLASTIHAHTTTAVTVGSANLEGVPMWAGLGLDFYAPHWYDPMSSGLACARCSDVATLRAAFGFDGLPIVIGELYASPSTDALQRYTDFGAKGFAGAWAWSLFSDHTSDKFPIDLDAARIYVSNSATTPTSSPAAAAAPPIDAKLLANWVSPTYVTAGEDVTISQDVRTNRDAAVLVDFEVFNATGQKIWQDSRDNQALSAQNVVSFSATFTTPQDLPPGQYAVKTSLFSPGWGTMYAWSDLAGSFVVGASSTPGPAASNPSDMGTNATDGGAVDSSAN